MLAAKLVVLATLAPPTREVVSETSPFGGNWRACLTGVSCFACNTPHDPRQLLTVSAAAERALLDYGDALRELAGIDVFPGDLPLKNFGVTSQGKVVFYDYDEVTSLRACNFRDLPVASNEEEEFSAEPWVFVSPDDIFPEQWLPFLGVPAELLDSFKPRHGDLLGPHWWRNLQKEISRRPPVIRS